MEITINVAPSADYQSLSTLGSISFTEGTVYAIQIVSGDVMIKEASSQPTAGGFHVHCDVPFNFTAGSDDLWIKNMKAHDTAIVEIAG